MKDILVFMEKLRTKGFIGSLKTLNNRIVKIYKIKKLPALVKQWKDKIQEINLLEIREKHYLILKA